MLAQEFLERLWQLAFGLLALGRALLVQILGHDDGHYYARPVRDGVAEKRPQMGFWVRQAIEDDQRKHDSQRAQAQGVLLQKLFQGARSLHATTVLKLASQISLPRQRSQPLSSSVSFGNGCFRPHSQADRYRVHHRPGSRGGRSTGPRN